MNEKEFIAYIEANAKSGVETWFEHAFADEERKNAGRGMAKKWNDAKMTRAVEKLWQQVAGGMYTTIGNALGDKNKDNMTAWLGMLSDETLENLSESLAEAQFGPDAE